MSKPSLMTGSEPHSPSGAAAHAPPAAAGQARRSARERLLEAAETLFYDEGINTVGIDRVIERAGVAKASLYDIYGSKEELIRAYLLSKQDARKARIGKVLARHATARDQLLGVFDSMAEVFAEPTFRGCAFIRASAESREGSRIRAVCDDSRRWLHDLFARLAREAGARDPAALAAQLLLVYDGALVASQMDHDTQAAKTARALAGVMLDAAVK